MTFITDALFCVVDTETTGLDRVNDRIVEIACASTSLGRQGGMWATLVNPGIPIPPETSAIHMLTDSDVADALDWHSAYVTLEYIVRGTPSTIVAHNAQFDQGFCDPDGRLGDWICTKRLAQHVWPDAPTYKNQGLRFWRKLKVNTFGIMAHRALGDALVTAALLRDILGCEEFGRFNVSTIAELVELSQRPILLKKWPFGKHFGQPIAGTDPSYIQWCLNLPDLDSDLRYTLQQELNNDK